MNGILNEIIGIYGDYRELISSEPLKISKK
jgi:hypothetical protein